MRVRPPLPSPSSLTPHNSESDNLASYCAWYMRPTEFRNLSCGEVISKFVDKCGEYGMLVMLDNHRLDEQNIPDLVSLPRIKKKAELPGSLFRGPPSDVIRQQGTPALTAWSMCVCLCVWLG